MSEDEHIALSPDDLEGIQYLRQQMSNAHLRLGAARVKYVREEADTLNEIERISQQYVLTVDLLVNKYAKHTTPGDRLRFDPEKLAFIKETK